MLITAYRLKDIKGKRNSILMKMRNGKNYDMKQRNTGK